MKRFLILMTLLLAVGSSASEARTRRQNKQMNRIAWRIAGAYKTKNLGALDRLRLLRSPLRIVIEHSVSPVREFESGRFRSFKAAERWLRKRERANGTPFRQVQTFTNCRKGRCRFDKDGGILHNQLYLKRISYGYRNGRPFIKELYFYDGD